MNQSSSLFLASRSFFLATGKSSGKWVKETKSTDGRMHFTFVRQAFKKLVIRLIRTPSDGSGKLNTSINILLVQVFPIARSCSLPAAVCWYKPFECWRLLITIIIAIRISALALQRHQPYDQRNQADLFLMMIRLFYLEPCESTVCYSLKKQMPLSRSHLKITNCFDSIWRRNRISHSRAEENN